MVERPKRSNLYTKPTLLKSIVDKVNLKIEKLKEPIQDRLNYIEEQLQNTDKSLNKYFSVIEHSDNPPSVILERITVLDNEKKELLEQKQRILFELNKPTIKNVSFEQVQNVLKTFSKILPTVDPEKQKNLLHTIIDKITVNAGKTINERSVKSIELFFDASNKSDFVLTCGTVHHY